MANRVQTPAFDTVKGIRIKSAMSLAEWEILAARRISQMGLYCKGLTLGYCSAPEQTMKLTLREYSEQVKTGIMPASVLRVALNAIEIDSEGAVAQLLGDIRALRDKKALLSGMVQVSHSDVGFSIQPDIPLVPEYASAIEDFYGEKGASDSTALCFAPNIKTNWSRLGTTKTYLKARVMAALVYDVATVLVARSSTLESTKVESLAAELLRLANSVLLQGAVLSVTEWPTPNRMIELPGLWRTKAMAIVTRVLAHRLQDVFHSGWEREYLSALRLKMDPELLALLPYMIPHRGSLSLLEYSELLRQKKALCLLATTNRNQLPLLFSLRNVAGVGAGPVEENAMVQIKECFRKDAPLEFGTYWKWVLTRSAQFWMATVPRGSCDIETCLQNVNKLWLFESAFKIKLPLTLYNGWFVNYLTELIPIESPAKLAKNKPLGIFAKQVKAIIRARQVREVSHLARYREVLDFLRAMQGANVPRRHRNRPGAAEYGVRLTRARTYYDLQVLSDQWHDQFRFEGHGYPYPESRSEFNCSLHYEPIVLDGVSFTEILDNQTLWHESNQQSHCVYTYEPSIRKKNCAIVKVEHKDGHRATLEVRLGGPVVTNAQLRAKGNREADPLVTKAVSAYLNHLNAQPALPMQRQAA